MRVAVGLTKDGHRRVLGVSMVLSEAEVHGRAFLDRLIRRGLNRDFPLAAIPNGSH